MFSSWLEQNRRALGLTQRQLGQQIGVGVSAVGMWERGRRVPGPRAAARLKVFFASRGIKMPLPLRQPELPERERFLAEVRRVVRSSND